MQVTRHQHMFIDMFYDDKQRQHFFHICPFRYNFPNFELECGFHLLNCLLQVKIEADGSRNCGLCGDPYLDPIPRANEAGGKYANPRIRTRYYESGQVADISIWNNLPGRLLHVLLYSQCLRLLH